MTDVTVTLLQDAEHDVTQAMKDSHVLQTKENLQWDWELVSAILKVSASYSQGQCQPLSRSAVQSLVTYPQLTAKYTVKVS